MAAGRSWLLQLVLLFAAMLAMRACSALLSSPAGGLSPGCWARCWACGLTFCGLRARSGGGRGQGVRGVREGGGGRDKGRLQEAAECVTRPVLRCQVRPTQLSERRCVCRGQGAAGGVRGEEAEVVLQVPGGGIQEQEVRPLPARPPPPQGCRRSPFAAVAQQRFASSAGATRRSRTACATTSSR